jgi:hypothetical protein
MAYAAYTPAQQVVAATTITAAKTALVSLCSIIFANRDFKNVEQEIADASKIRFGLMAISQAETSTTAYNQIIMGLTKLAQYYNLQIATTIT